jgi:hypothetical protein
MSFWFLFVKPEDAASLVKKQFSFDQERLQLVRLNREILQDITSGSELYGIQFTAIERYMQGCGLQERKEFLASIQDRKLLMDLIVLLKHPNGLSSWWSRWSTKMKSCFDINPTIPITIVNPVVSSAIAMMVGGDVRSGKSSVTNPILNEDVWCQRTTDLVAMFLKSLLTR